MIKHFVDIKNFKKNELNSIILKAKSFKKNIRKNAKLFNNKSIGLLFEKQSTRTRVSFNIGVQKFGGNAIELYPESIGFGKRESDKDILMTLSQYIDCLVIRNDNHEKIKYLSDLNIIPIINALSNQSHPCQIISDLFTIKERLGSLINKKICWIGDYNNVLRSLIEAQQIFCFKLTAIIPKKILQHNNSEIRIFKNKNLKFTSDLKEGVSGSDCLMTDVWLSMGEKDTKKKSNFKNYTIDNSLMSFAKKGAIFMHCLPAHRGEEVSDEVIDGSKSVVWEQAQNRMYVQQAILNFIFNNKK